MIEDEIVIVEYAESETRGDGSEGSEGSFDTEWDYNSEDD